MNIDIAFPLHANQVFSIDKGSRIVRNGQAFFADEHYIVRGQFLKWLDAFKCSIFLTRKNGKFLRFAMAKTTPANGGYYVLQQAGKEGRYYTELERAIVKLRGIGIRLTVLSPADWLYDETRKRYGGEIAGWLRIGDPLEPLKKKYGGHESDTDADFVHWMLYCFDIRCEYKGNNEVLIYK